MNRLIIPVTTANTFIQRVNETVVIDVEDVEFVTAAGRVGVENVISFRVGFGAQAPRFLLNPNDIHRLVDWLLEASDQLKQEAVEAELQGVS